MKIMNKYYIILFTFLLLSCRTQKIVEFHDKDTAEVRTEYIHKTDSFYQRDSIYLESKTINDTVYLTKELWKTILRHDHDTITKTDTLRIVDVQKVDKEVIKKDYDFTAKVALICIFLTVVISTIYRKD